MGHHADDLEDQEMFTTEEGDRAYTMYDDFIRIKDGDDLLDFHEDWEDELKALFFMLSDLSSFYKREDINIHGCDLATWKKLYFILESNKKLFDLHLMD